MKKAIVTGATGFIGSYLVKALIKDDVEVLALGRKNWNEIDGNRLNSNEKLTYLKIDMSDIENLPERINDINWDSSDSCVFYNFAWGGASSLSDLEIGPQLSNVTWSANALIAAKNIGCVKFVHVGTMEEAFTQKYLKLDYSTNKEYNRHVIYSVAKMVSRNLLKVVSADYKIDLIIATNSHVMGPFDDKDSFLQVTLQKLMENEELIFSTGEQLFDVISVNDCALAYKLIGSKGKAGQEYWIGSGSARPLKNYVQIMAELYPSKQDLQFGKYEYNDISLKKEDFNIDNLVQDTGFRPLQTYEDTVHELYNWLKISQAAK